MNEMAVVIVLFWLGWYLGNSVGQNTGYLKGWKDKENGKPYKPPK